MRDVKGDYQYVSASPGIDVLSYHDYYGPAALGGDQWNGLPCDSPKWLLWASRSSPAR